MNKTEKMLAELWLETGEPEQERELAELLTKMDVTEADLTEIKEREFEDMDVLRRSVREKTLQKTEPACIRTRRSVWRRAMFLAAGAAAALLILFVSLEPEAAAKVVKGWFALLPGMSVVETEEDIYFLKETVSSQNEQYKMEITNAKLTGQELIVYLVVTPDEPLTEKEAEWEGYSGRINEDDIRLEWNGEIFDPVSASGAKGDIYHYEACFELPEMNTGKEAVQMDGKAEIPGEQEGVAAGKPKEYTMTLLYGGSISCDFVLAGAEHYQKLSELGAAACHNDIWIAASSQRDGEKLRVDLYALNQSEYKLLSMGQSRGGVGEADGNSYPGIQAPDEEADLDYCLKADGREIRDYEYTARFGGSPSLTFTGEFAGEAVLVIPSLLVQAKEEQKVTIPIPKQGEILTLNQEVAFEGGSYRIGNISREEREPFGKEWLKIELETVETEDGRVLTDVDLGLNRGFFSQDNGSYTYSRETDENGNLTAVYWKLREEDTKRLNLILKDPTYRLLEEYELKLEAEP